jgi:zinc protease
MQFIKYNNYNILLIPNKNSEVVLIESYINSGCVNETNKNLGISHLAEHVICSGWKKCKTNCFNYWKKKGAIINAMTSDTYVKYYINGLKKHTVEMLDYIISITINPEIKKSRIEKEKTSVKQELNMYLNDPAYPIYNETNKLLFNIEGLILQDDMKLQKKNLPLLKAQDLKNWHETYYTSNNILFTVTGDFNKVFVLQKMKRLLKNSNSVSLPPLYNNVFRPGFEIKYIKTRSSPHTNVCFAFYNDFNYSNNNYIYIDFIKNFINTSLTSILFNLLREKMKLIYSINFFNSTNQYGSFFTIHTTCDHENTKILIHNTIRVLNDLVNGKYKPQYIKYIKDLFITEHYNKCKQNYYYSQFYSIQYLNQLNSHNKHIITIDEYVNLIKKLTKSKINRLLKETFNIENMKIIYKGSRKFKLV